MAKYFNYLHFAEIIFKFKAIVSNLSNFLHKKAGKMLIISAK